MKYSFTSLVLATLASAAAVNTDPNPVSVSLTSMGNSVVKAVLTNNDNKGYNIMHKGTFLDDIPVNKFQVKKGSNKANFHGIKLRMGASGFEEDDFTALFPGESKEVVVDLAELYGLDESGTYDVAAKGRFNIAEMNSTELIRGGGLRYNSNKLSINVNGKQAGQVIKAIEAILQSRSTINSTCTDSQTSTVADGLSRCESQAEAAAEAALNGSESKFEEYFMSTSDDDKQYVADRFNAVAKECSSSTSGTLDLHCEDTYNGCKSNTFAYAISSENVVVWCDAYWNAELETSTCHGDDKAGTTIHEFTHVDDVFSPGTDDHAYTYENCIELDREEALENADTYEYYANGKCDC